MMLDDLEMGSFFNPNRCSTQVWHILCYLMACVEDQGVLSVCMCGGGALWLASHRSRVRVFPRVHITYSPSRSPACFPLPFASRPASTLGCLGKKLLVGKCKCSKKDCFQFGEVDCLIGWCSFYLSFAQLSPRCEE